MGSSKDISEKCPWYFRRVQEENVCGSGFAGWCRDVKGDKGPLGNIGVILGIMENKMETTIVCWGYIGIGLALGSHPRSPLLRPRGNKAHVDPNFEGSLCHFLGEMEYGGVSCARYRIPG